MTTKTELKFSFLPRHCKDTNESIWFKYGYRERRTITGPGTPVIIDTWYSKVAFLMQQLKKP